MNISKGVAWICNLKSLQLVEKRRVVLVVGNTRGDDLVGNARASPLHGTRIVGRVDAVVKKMEGNPFSRSGAQLEQRIDGANSAY